MYIIPGAQIIGKQGERGIGYRIGATTVWFYSRVVTIGTLFYDTRIGHSMKRFGGRQQLHTTQAFEFICTRREASGGVATMKRHNFLLTVPSLNITDCSPFESSRAFKDALQGIEGHVVDQILRSRNRSSASSCASSSGWCRDSTMVQASKLATVVSTSSNKSHTTGDFRLVPDGRTAEDLEGV